MGCASPTPRPSGAARGARHRQLSDVRRFCCARLYNPTGRAVGAPEIFLKKRYFWPKFRVPVPPVFRGSRFRFRRFRAVTRPLQFHRRFQVPVPPIPRNQTGSRWVDIT